MTSEFHGFNLLFCLVLDKLHDEMWEIVNGANNDVDKHVQENTRDEMAEKALADRLRLKDKQMEETAKARRKAKFEKRMEK